MPVTCQSHVRFSESNRLLNCTYATVRKVASDFSLMIFSCYSPLGHFARRKIQILLNISTLFSSRIFLFLVIWWLLPTPPSCWMGVHYACHRSAGNCQVLDTTEPFLCWTETTEMIVLNQKLLSLAVQVIWDHINASSIYMLFPWWDCLLSWLSEINLSFWLSKFCLEWHQIKWLLPGWELFLPLPHICSLGICKAKMQGCHVEVEAGVKKFLRVYMFVGGRLQQQHYVGYPH